MPKFMTANIQTPARMALARLHEARSEAAAEANEARARIGRLAEIAKSADPIKTKLGALDAQEAANFSAWSRGDFDTPVSGRRHRRPRCASARACRRSGASGRRKPRHRWHWPEVAAANAKVAAAEAQVPLAAAVVMLETLGPIADEARAAVAKIAELRMKGHTLLNELLSVSSSADVTPSGRTEFDANTEQRAAPSPTLSTFLIDADAAAVFRAKVLAMLTALRSDAGAKLEVA